VKGRAGPGASPPPPPQLALAIRRRSTARRLAPCPPAPARPRPPGSARASPSSLTPQRSPTPGDLRHAPSALPRQEASTTTVRSRSCTGCKDLAWKPPSMPGLVSASRRRHGLAFLGAAGPLTSARGDRPQVRRPTFPQVRADVAVVPGAASAVSRGRAGPQGDPYGALSIFRWAVLWPPVP